MNKFSAAIMSIVRQAVDRQFDGNMARASRAWGVTGDNLYKWLRGDRVPTLDKISPILDQLGVSVMDPRPSEPSREVCFVRPSLPLREHASMETLRAEDYIAVPLVGEVGAGPGYIPQNDSAGNWFLVYRYQPAIMHRRNLIAVKIGQSSVSMQPTLNPGDIVLVDRDDRDVGAPGHIMLVIDPLDGSGMIRRVAVTKLDCHDFRITCYSDNASRWPPLVYSLQKDFCGEWERAIAGRAIWAWTDVRQK